MTKVQFLVRQDVPGGLPRYYWQPSAKRRSQGYQQQRVPLDWQSFTDPVKLEAAAVARAVELTREMEAALAATALEQARPPMPVVRRTVHELATQYRGSDGFMALRPKTQRDYRQCLDRIEAWAGDVPVGVVDARRIQVLRKGMRGTPAMANAVVRVLRLLLEFARRDGWISVNPAIRPGLSGGLPTGLIWPPAAVSALVDAADRLGWPSVGTAVMLNEWLGQREGDILRMPRVALRDGTLVLRQSKTGAGVSLPIGRVPHLVERLNAETARTRAREAGGAPAATTILVCETTGQPWKADYFRHVFARCRTEAIKMGQSYDVGYLLPGRDMTDPDAFRVRMSDLTFKQLRHTAITRLAEAGCDAALIASVSGHALATVQMILERYLVRTSTMARVAFDLRLKAEGAERAPAGSEQSAIRDV